jgi:hypothetical protein
VIGRLLAWKTLASLECPLYRGRQLTWCSVAGELSQLEVTGVELAELANSALVWRGELAGVKPGVIIELLYLVHHYRIWFEATTSETPPNSWS